MSLSATRCSPRGIAQPAPARPSRGVRQSTSSATNETTNAAAAPISASVNGSGNSVAVPTPCAGSGIAAATRASSDRRAQPVCTRGAALGCLRPELVFVDELRQLWVVSALQPDLLAPGTCDNLGRQAGVRRQSYESLGLRLYERLQLGDVGLPQVRLVGDPDRAMFEVVHGVLVRNRLVIDAAGEPLRIV